MSDGRVMEKPGAGINLFLSNSPREPEGLTSPSGGHMPSQQMVCGDMWDLSRYIVEQKLVINVLPHQPS